jgi:diadenosine tetraphosphate (Ap4A) HIT family hydrolase
LWDNIVRTPGWDVAHAFGTSVEGWTVLAVRRHITSVASLTDSEAAELGQLVRDVSAGIQAITDCHKTYIAQFAEHVEHPHVHFHVIPRAPGLPHEYQGPRVFSLGGVPEDEAVPEPRMTAFAQQLRHRLAG